MGCLPDLLVPDFWTINSRFPVQASRKYFEIFAWCLNGKPTVDGSEIWLLIWVGAVEAFPSADQCCCSARGDSGHRGRHRRCHGHSHGRCHGHRSSLRCGFCAGLTAASLQRKGSHRCQAHCCQIAQELHDHQTKRVKRASGIFSLLEHVFGKESTGLVERRHASAKSAESSIQQRGLVLGGLGAWWFWDSIGVLTVCTSNFYPFHKRIPTESKPLGPKPPINHQLINVFQNGCRRKCLLVKNRVDETSAVITVDGSFWLI